MNIFLPPLAVLLFCAAVSGCATDIPPATALVDGGPVAAPAGWIGYCRRHAEDDACRS